MNDRNRNKIPSIRYAPLAYALILALASGAAYADTKLSKTSLPDIQVSGLQYPIAITQSSAGTKTDTPIIETPQSISVVGQREMENRDVRNLHEAMSYTPGYSSVYAYQGWPFYSIRGFSTTAMHHDGMYSEDSIVGSEQEPYGLEKVELLKGPSSIMYGHIEPGGMMNLVTKRPLKTPLRELQASFGSFHRKQIAADFSGPLTQDKTLTYRVTGLLRRSDSRIQHQPDDADYIAASLKWQPNEQFSFLVQASHQNNKQPYGSYEYIGGKGVLTPLVDGSYIPRDFFIGEPGLDYWRTKHTGLGYVLQYNFNPNLKLTHELRHSYAPSSIMVTRFAELQPDGRTLGRTYVDDRDAVSNILSSDTRLEYEWGGESIQHTSLFGINYFSNKQTSKRFDRELSSTLDALNPVYGHYELSPRELDEAYKDHIKQLGVYLQDQMKINHRWIVLGGIRHDWLNENYHNPFTGEIIADNDKQNAFTWKLGSVYLFDHGLAPYFSVSTSFQHKGGRDRFGQLFKPMHGRQYEVGLRYQPPGSDTLLSAAVYTLERRNETFRDPEDRSYEVQVGKTRSRGIEIEAKTTIGEDTHLTAGYAYTDTRITKSIATLPQLVGRRTIGVPYHQFSLWADYNLTSIGLPDLAVGLGMRFQKDTSDGMGNKAPRSTKAIFDGLISYEHGSWKVALHGKNLTDKKEIVCAWGDCMYGMPRYFNLTATYRW